MSARARAIIHLDLDAFYASVEQRDHPAWRGKPLIVGGHPTRGVVLAASYEVRPFGVRSAMPMSRAVRQAPNAIVVPPRPQAYAEASEAVFEILESVTPLVEPLSLDEAFLDVTASQALFGTPSAIARNLRARIKAEVGLNASAGICEVKFAAKVATDMAKPDGQLEVAPGTTRAFLAPLPVSRLWGVGPKTEQVLLGLGLRTLGAVADKEVAWLEEKLGALGPHLHDLAQGIDPRAVEPERGRKSVGVQDTFTEDIADRESLWPHLHAQAWRVARRTRRENLRGRVVHLKVRFSDFTSISRQTTLAHPIDDGQTLYQTARALLDAVELPRPVRLTGVSLSDFGTDAPQLSLFEAEPPPEKQLRLNRAIDAIAQRYGVNAVRPADVADLDDSDREALHPGAKPRDA